MPMAESFRNQTTSSLQITGLKALVGLHGRMDGRIRAVLLAEQVVGRVNVVCVTFAPLQMRSLPSVTAGPGSGGRVTMTVRRTLVATTCRFMKLPYFPNLR